MAESKDNGRIVYIEPNNIPAIKAAGYAGGVKSDENPDGLIPDNITWNPEDLNISVDLQVIIPSREHRENMNYEKNALFNPKYASYKSFFSGIDIGGNNMLTDDYTNISYEEIRINGAGSRESLGVTSINIKFDPNLYPVVTMKFTDVRAASLMAPAEQAFLDKKLKSEQICRNFFSALFKFPYPLFNLTVKGMFGTRVTFRLSVIDFKSNYNGDTGNYDVTVTFMGNIYGLYTDIPFRFLLIAPYIGATGGSTNEYWTKETETGGRFFYNEHGKSGNKIMTFLDYVRNYKEALSGADSSADESEEGINGLTGVEAKKQILNHVMDRYNAFISYPGRLTESIEGGIYRLRSKKVTGGDNDEDSVIFFDDDITEMKFKSDKAEAIIKEAKEIKSGFDEAGIGAPSIISKIAELDASASPSLKLSGPYVDNAGKLTPLGLSLDGYQRNVLENFKDDIIGGKTLNGKYGYHIKENAIDLITKKLSSLDEEADILKKKASEEMLTRFKEGIGFEPTVENAFRMIFAHMDTFLHYFYDCIDRIPLERTLSQFSIKIDDTDIDSPGQENAFMPPFTAFYRESKKNGDQPERYYPGDSGSNSNLRGIHEVKFVEDIFNGINSLAELIRQPDPDMNESEEEETETGNQTVDTGKTFEQKFLPLVVTDIFYEGKNPYDLLTAGWETPDALLKFYVSRKYISEYINDGKNGVLSIFSDPSAVEKNEVENLYRSKIWGKIEASHEKYQSSPYSGYTTNSWIATRFTPYKINSIPQEPGGDFTEKMYTFVTGNTNNADDLTYKILSGYSDTSIRNFAEAMEKSKVYSKAPVYTNVVCLKILPGTPTTLLYPMSQNREGRYVPGYEFKMEGGNVAKVGDIYDPSVSYTKKNPLKFHRSFNYLTISDDKFKKNSIKYYEDIFNQKYPDEMWWIPFVSHWDGKRGDINYLFSEDFWGDGASDLELGMRFLWYVADSIASPFYYNGVNRQFIAKIPKFYYLFTCLCAWLYRHGDKDNDCSWRNVITVKGCKKFIEDKFPEYRDEEILYLADIFEEWGNSESETGWKTILSALREEKNGKEIWAKMSYDEIAAITNPSLSDVITPFGFLHLDKISSAIKGALKNGAVRIFDPYGKFNRIFVKFFRETVYTIYLKKRDDTKEGLSLNFSSHEISVTDDNPRRITVKAADKQRFYNEIRDKIKSSPVSQRSAEPNEDDSPYMNNPIVEVDFSKASTSQRNSLYYTLKNLYDRWISTYSENQFHLNSPEQEEADKRKRFVGTDDANGATDNGIESEFNSFLYVDKFYNDISKKFIFNPTKFGNLLEMELDASTNHSVISFISEFCKNNKLLFRCLPVRNSLYNLETIMDMFTPMSPYSGKNRMGLGVGNTYLIMYTYEPSHKLALINDQKEGVGYKNDSFDIADVTGKITDEAKKLLNGSYDPDELRLNVCAFGVTPNAQNQSYFTKVSVGMDNPRVTEQVIKNTIELASMAKKGGVSAGNGNGQDIYSVYSNRSYDCRVDMLGCMNIMPMMYFQLNNLPMFRGAYMITSVEHNIQNNTMTTSFVGQRQSKYLIPLDTDIFNIAGLSEIVSNTVNSMKRVDVPYSANPHGYGEFGTFDGKNIIYPAQGTRSEFNRTFYVASAVKQMGYKYPNEKGAPAPYGNGKSYHICATAVKAFVWAGFNGYADNTKTSKIFNAGYSIGSIGNGYSTYKRLQEIGFRVIATNSDLLNGFEPDAGDIGIMDHGEYGHICMWTGHQWVSDFTQNNLWVYGASTRPKKNDKAIMVLRYWGPIDYTTEKKFGE